MGVMQRPSHTSGGPSPQTAPHRREFLGSFLGALLFWRARRQVKLAGITFLRIRHGRARRRYLLIHGNEETARRVLTVHLDSAHGIAYLVRNVTRNVALEGGELDPNRMFSRTGAERNLRTLNPKWPATQVQQELDRLDRQRNELLDAIHPGQGDVLIALHNNVDYSVDDELAGSNRVALNDLANRHDFCLCTAQGDFDLLSRGSYNVVLQDKPPGADDGSLSRYAARRGFRYVNIEAAMGRFDKQRAMLAWVDATLPRV